MQTGLRVTRNGAEARRLFEKRARLNILHLALYTGCTAGASVVSDVEKMLQGAGFTNRSIVPKDESRSFIRDWARGTDISDYVVSATIEAVKPAP